MLLTSRDLAWTNHAKEKLAYYNLSERRILRILRHSHRTEEGVAEGTLASMQRAGSKRHPYEIWVMYQIISQISNLKMQNDNAKCKKIENAKCKKISQISNLTQHHSVYRVVLGKSQNSKSKKQKAKLKTQKDRSFKVKIISAWRYPGISPKGEAIPIPEEILEELRLK